MHIHTNLSHDESAIRFLYNIVPWSDNIQTLRWRNNGHDSVSNHQPHDCLLNRLFRRRSKKISKLRVTGLCAGNSPDTGEFPAQMASNAESVSIWWHHHVLENHLFINITTFYLSFLERSIRSFSKIAWALPIKHFNAIFFFKSCMSIYPV